jgi:hypothetical protein
MYKYKNTHYTKIKLFKLKKKKKLGDSQPPKNSIETNNEKKNK